MQANKEIYLPGDLLIEKFSTSRIIIQISTNDQDDSGCCDLIVGYTQILIRNFVGAIEDTENFRCLWSKK